MQSSGCRGVTPCDCPGCRGLSCGQVPKLCKHEENSPGGPGFSNLSEAAALGLRGEQPGPQVTAQGLGARGAAETGTLANTRKTSQWSWLMQNPSSLS